MKQSKKAHSNLAGTKERKTRKHKVDRVEFRRSKNHGYLAINHLKASPGQPTPDPEEYTYKDLQGAKQHLVDHLASDYSDRIDTGSKRQAHPGDFPPDIAEGEGEDSGAHE